MWIKKKKHTRRWVKVVWEFELSGEWSRMLELVKKQQLFRSDRITKKQNSINTTIAHGWCEESWRSLASIAWSNLKFLNRYISRAPCMHFKFYRQLMTRTMQTHFGIWTAFLCGFHFVEVVHMTRNVRNVKRAVRAPPHALTICFVGSLLTMIAFNWRLKFIELSKLVV